VPYLQLSACLNTFQQSERKDHGFGICAGGPLHAAVCLFEHVLENGDITDLVDEFNLNNLRLVLILIDENRLISELFVYTESEVKAAHSPWDFESVF
jgi:hypothetical protein